MEFHSTYGFPFETPPQNAGHGSLMFGPRQRGIRFLNFAQALSGANDANSVSHQPIFHNEPIVHQEGTTLKTEGPTEVRQGPSIIRYK